MQVDSPHHVASERDAIAAVQDFDGAVIVDLDETLYLQNSTADFIDCAAPALAALLGLKLLDIAAPWRWTGGRVTRDLWRVRLIRALFPWANRRWRARCRTHAPALVNAPLLQALRARGEPFIIATTGFTSIVRPLVEAMGCGDARVIACAVDRPADRTGGKAALIQAAIGADELGRALFVTDSRDDLDVLERCAEPHLVKWQSARFQRPFQAAYFPGAYTLFVKRPGVGGINGIITTLCFWLMLTLTSSSLSPELIPAVLLMFGSFWAVYECGYLDNDNCARRYEADGVVTTEFTRFDQRHFGLKAWGTALVLGAGGLTLLGQPLIGEGGLAWLALLAGTVLMFRVYNRLDKATRVWLYLPLQSLREGGFLVFAAIGPAGAMACAAHITSKWQEYYIYRFARESGAKTWPGTPHRTVRLILFVFLVSIYTIATRRPAALLNWQALVLLTFNVAVARRELRPILTGARRIDRSEREGEFG